METVPEDLDKCISISGAQKTQSDPCYTLTKVLIRISLKGRERRREKHIARGIGCFWTGACRTSSLLSQIIFRRNRNCVWMISSLWFILLQSIFVCFFFFFFFRTKVSHAVLVCVMIDLLKSTIFVEYQ